MLAVLGIPPTLGFIGRWRIYETAAQEGKVWLAVLVAASMIALIAYVRALTGTWWGASPAETPRASTTMETGVGNTWVVLLAAALVIAGVMPFGLEIMLRGIR
jgi:NADH:ubiquinone oxidoreductase subunit 2 (subunit N)